VLTGDWAEAERFLTELLQEQQQPARIDVDDDDDDDNNNNEAGAGAARAPLAVVKPTRGAASGDVYVCGTVEEARAAFEAILNAPTYGGGVNEAVLVQEFLAGQEWAVDTVSRDGEGKVVAVWRYDKRAANGAPCVYYGTMLEAAPEGSEARRVAEYVVQHVLPALRVDWGPTHTEVIVAPAAGRAGALPGEATTPVVVECNCRWHLCNFVPVTHACLGVNAVDATLDAFVDPEAWARVPAMPEKVRVWVGEKGGGREGRDVSVLENGVPVTIAMPCHAMPSPSTTHALTHSINPSLHPSINPPLQLKAHGRVVHLVCSGQGRVAAHRHVAAIEALESVKEVEIYASFDVGELVSPTVDIRTDAGYVLLVHEDPKVVERDYAAITALQPEIIHVVPVSSDS
jgi:hypothetical protein